MLCSSTYSDYRTKMVVELKQVSLHVRKTMKSDIFLLPTIIRETIVLIEIGKMLAIISVLRALDILNCYYSAFDFTSDEQS